MKVIGLTGIFGSGKSTVAGFLKEQGAAVIYADEVAHQVYEPDTEGWRRLVTLFGRGVLAEDGRIDRGKLGAIVFKDRAALDKLNAAIHPLAAKRVKALLEEYRRRHTPVVVVEAPLLLEAGWASMTSEVWVATAPREVIFRRLSRERGLSHDAALARIRTQLPVNRQVQQASRVINTDTSLERLRAKIRRLWPKVIS